MKQFIDGDQLCITKDDFVDLQESPAVFYPLTSEIAKTILADGIRGLPVGDLMSIYDRLNRGANRCYVNISKHYQSIFCAQSSVLSSACTCRYYSVISADCCS